MIGDAITDITRYKANNITSKSFNRYGRWPYNETLACHPQAQAFTGAHKRALPLFSLCFRYYERNRQMIGLSPSLFG